ncbi:MAG: hypothetical protein NTX91_02015 [candidate division SR1 bacterium]|nr:hypothetical protein [candidate division SR1 bacterium]
MTNLDFKKQKDDLTDHAKKVYLSIVNAQGRIEDDPTKVRTGIGIFLGDPDSRNFIKESIFDPSSDAVHFASEKVTRMMTLGDASSANSANPNKMKYPGAVRVKMTDGTIIAAGGSGLKAAEDVVHSILMLAYALDCKPQDVINNIKSHDGILPDEISWEDHYLNAVLAEYA